MIDKIIESLESMAEDMRAMGDAEEASGVDSALWLIEEMTKKADAPQTEQTEPSDKLTARCLNCKDAKACKENNWEGCKYETYTEQTEPQTDCSWK